MARTREFDEEVAVEKAMALFWSRGYQAASLNELLEATDLSRSSFYEAFGTKRDLLLAALSRYAASGMCGLAQPLFAEKAGRKEIERVFNNMVDHAMTDHGHRGCMINNCATEVAPHDAEVMQAVRAARKGLERALTGAIKRGQMQGEITQRESAAALARFLATALSGINVLSKTRPTRTALNDVVRVSLSVLD